MRLSKETKIQIVLNFNKFDSPIRLQRYLKSLNRKEVPSRATIQNTIKKFKELSYMEHRKPPRSPGVLG